MSSTSSTTIDNWMVSTGGTWHEAADTFNERAEAIEVEIGVMEVLQPRYFPTAELPVSISYPRYRTRSLVFSSFALAVGLLDLYAFLFENTYLFHPYFGGALCIGGGFLLATTVLAIRGK